MIVTEIFNTSSIHWVEQEPDYCRCEFMVGQNQYYMSATEFSVDEDLPNRWDVEFGYIGADTHHGVHKNTGLGKSAMVFSNVVAAFKEFFAKYSPVYITMSAADSGRHHLYMKILRRILPSWQIIEHDGGIHAHAT